MRKTEGACLKSDPPVTAEGVSKLPLVSVIMNCYNGEEYLRDAVDSVLRQTYGNWELVFWDNASEDGTAEIIHSYTDGRVRYHRGSENVPLGMARNLALEQANGELIAFLDSDDRWLPHKLELQARWLLAHPEAGFCYSNYFKLVKKGTVRQIALSGAQPQGDVFAPFLRQYPVNLQTVILRRSTLTQGFDPELEVSEEYDLFMRLLVHVQAGYIDEPLVEYRIHDAMSSVRKIERYALENACILKKLLILIPDLEQRYPAELEHFRAKLGYYQARAEMSHNRPRQARAALRPYIHHDKRFLALYLMAWLGRFAWNFIHRSAGRYTR